MQMVQKVTGERCINPFSPLDSQFVSSKAGFGFQCVFPTVRLSFVVLSLEPRAWHGLAQARQGNYHRATLKPRNSTEVNYM
jgi:hypothetical protein